MVTESHAFVLTQFMRPGDLTYDPTNEEREHLTTALPSFFSKDEETDLNRNFGSGVEVEKYQDVDQHSY